MPPHPPPPARGAPHRLGRGLHCRHQGIAIIAIDTDHVQPVQLTSSSQFIQYDDSRLDTSG